MRRPGIGVLFTAVACLFSAGATPAEEADRISNWTAPPFWTAHEAGAPSETPDGNDAARAKGRAAGGRQALVANLTALPFIAVFPCRLVDTRGNGAPLTGGFLPPATVRNYTLAGVCNIPTTAWAISLNVTVVKPTGPGFLTIWPQGGTFPPVSTLNYLGNDVIVNAAVVPLSTLYTGGISVALGVSGGDVILDTNGYYEPRAEVDTFNGVTGDVTLVAGTNITITPLASSFTISATGGAGGVTSVAGTNGISASPSTGAVTVTSNATSENTASTIVARDSGGTFNASTINLLNFLNLVTTGPGISSGAIGIGGIPFLHALGSRNTFLGMAAGNSGMTVASATDNTAVGYSALSRVTTGNNNSAFGASAMAFDSTGSFNSAFGQGALQNNAGGSANSAFGQLALQNNATGSNNTAFGTSALQNNNVNNSSAFGTSALRQNTSGADNSAFGFNALTANSTGAENSAFGLSALASNATGNRNTAVGTNALLSGSNGADNTAVGRQALTANNGGSANTAVGMNALVANTSGGNNVAIGRFALNSNTTGSNNIAIGTGAGTNLSSGGNNIYLGATGNSTESNTLRLGSTGQTSAFIEGVSGQTSASGVAVFINSGGKLGTTTSSRRFKEEILDMDSESDVLLKLRPVSFIYKPEVDPSRTPQYGLIAEEVAEVAPALAVFDKDGRPETVRYHFVNAMLLNEVQKSRRLIDELRADRTELLRRLDALEQRVFRAIDKRSN